MILKKDFRLLSLGVFIIFIASATKVFAQEKAITPEMVADLKSVRQVALSPDAKHVAYILSTPRNAEDEIGSNYSEIWLVSTDGGAARQFTFKPINASQVQWSPGGEKISFRSTRKDFDENAQVYAISIHGGEAAAVTNHNASVGSYAWSPDGKMIAFTSRDPESEEVKKAKKRGADQIVVDENFRHNRLWVWNVETGEAHKAYDADMTTWAFTWAPDGATLAIQATETTLIDDSYMYKKIYTVDAKGGEPKLLCKTEGKLGGMAFSPDGSQLAFAGAVDLSDPIAQSTFVVSANGGEPRNLTEGYQGSVNGIVWADDKSLLAFATEGTHSVFKTVNVENGNEKAVLSNGPVAASFDFNRKSGKFALVASTPSHPAEAYVTSLKNGGVKRLTNSNPELAEVRMAKQEVVTWNGPDGLEIEGVLTYPLDYKSGQKYPLVLQIHGGPEGVSLNDWRTRAGYPVQVIAANGYFVLEPNYRGSGGKGVAFSKADHDDLGGKEFQDVLNGVDALIERGLVDGERIGTGGWSYGGYFSAWAATKHSKRFKASVMAAGISNWVSFSGTTDIPHEMALVHWNSYWYTERDLHWERSPLYHIKNAQTPTLVVHGQKDVRVHPGQGMEMYQSLKHNGVPTKLILYPREPHGLTEREHKIDYIRRVVDWYNRYLQQQGTN